MNLDKIKSLLSRITKGPWKSDPVNELVKFPVKIRELQTEKVLCRMMGTDDIKEDAANAEFIAAAPEIVSQLLEEREKLKELLLKYFEIQRLKEKLSEMQAADIPLELYEAEKKFIKELEEDHGK